MNLIEQLGGYEKAKAKAKQIEFNLSNLEFLGGGSPRESMYERLDSIENALLEHRRENNIFEKGDKVIFVSEKMDFLDDDKVHEISVITENNLLKVCGLYVGLDAVKHATPQEIAQGYRDE